MDFVNCPRCGKLFHRTSSSICPPCVKDEEKIFDKVRDFVKENPDKSVKEVAEECEVTVKRIMQYVKDGRIQAGVGMKGEFTCSQCGKPIITGRMCEKCILETNFQVGEMKKQADIRNRGQIFTMRKKDR
ncbi:MAG: flagellar protein [Clostridiales bacterium]|jgi:ribosomal protein L32|nr:flagellar protein [Clostridiales bacterium]